MDSLHNTTSCPPLLTVNGLRKSFGSRVVLDQLHLEVRKGDVIVLRGANGSGKTTLIDILSGVVEPDRGEIQYLLPKGKKYRFDGTWRGMMRVKSRFNASHLARAGVGRCWQDVRLFNSLSLLENIAVAYHAQIGENILGAMRRKAMIARDIVVRREALDILTSFGLAARAALSPSSLSTGQVKRVAIARSLAAGASLLFLDEPLAGLDAEGVTDALRTLKQLRAGGVTLVIVEHLFNIPRMLDLATHLWTLEDGRLTAETVQSIRNRLATDSGVQGWKSALLAGLPQCSVKQLPGGATLTIADRCTGSDQSICLEIKNLVVKRGNRQVIGWGAGENSEAIGGFSLKLRESQLAILEAPNGWGKSTLFEAISGLIQPAAGSVIFRGREITGCSPWERRNAGIGLLGANREGFQRLSVIEVFRLAGMNTVPERLRRFRTQPVGTLSGGEYQTVRLNMAFQSNLHLGLLDEPFQMLDHAATSDLITRLRGCSDGAMLIATPKPV